MSRPLERPLANQSPWGTNIDAAGYDLSDLGKLNFDEATTLTISSGAITITQSYHYVDTEAAAATDDLDTINGGTAGDILFLRTVDSTRDVVIKHGTGNIVTSDGSDYTMDSTDDVVQLIFDGTNWHLVSAGGAAAPGGSDGQIQYNDGGVLGGASVYWDDVNSRLGILSSSPQTDVVIGAGKEFAIEMSPPSNVTATTSAGGTLNGTYYYKVSASDGTGWTVLSSEVSATVDGGTTAGTITVSWDAVPGASSYRVWRGTSSGGQNEYYETTSTSLADDGSLVFTVGTPPTTTDAFALSASNQLGLGTQAPAALLDVNGTAHLRGAAGGTGLYVDSSSNVGVGVTSPSYTFHVQGTVSSGSGAIPLAYFYRIADQSVDTAYAPVACRAYAANIGSGAITNNITGLENIVVQNGSGTIATAVGAKMQIQNIHATGTITTGVALAVAGPYIPSTGTIGTLYGLRVYTQSKTGVTTAYGIAQEGTDDTNYFLGNTGINTTAPAALLDVNGTAQLRGAAGGTGLYVDSSSRVGINTTTPGDYFECNGVGRFTSRVQVVGHQPLPLTRGGIEFGHDPTNDWGFVESFTASDTAYRPFLFSAQNVRFLIEPTGVSGNLPTELYRFTDTGLGILTTAPTHPLHVAGDIRTDGTINWADTTNYTSTTATAGTATLPSAPEGFIIIQVGGVNKKIPYYGV